MHNSARVGYLITAIGKFTTESTSQTSKLEKADQNSNLEVFRRKDTKNAEL
jgi:hypothetical protein